MWRRPPNWFTQHKVITGVGSVAVIIALIVAAASGSKKAKPSKATAAVAVVQASPTPAGTTPTATATPSPTHHPSQTPTTKATATAPTKPAAPAPTVDKTKAQAAKWVASMAGNANTVVVGIQAVQAGLLLIEQDPNNANADGPSFANLVSQSHSFLNGVRDSFAGGTLPSSLQNAQAEMTDAANTLKNSTGTILTYLQTPNDVVLGRFESQYTQGISEWNDAVTQIWDAAGLTPPTIPAS